MHTVTQPFNTAVFPGQGSQRRGMAMDFVDSCREAKAVFEAAADALSFDVESICRDDDARLNLTEFTQPCILAAEIASFVALKINYGFSPTYFAGHSLGEYAALVAAGAIPLSTALRLVHLRGSLMQRAVPIGKGAMAALIMNPLPLAEIREIANAEELDIANDNSPEQIVLSGTNDALDRVLVHLVPWETKGLRVVRLTVSAPFHSRQMKSIEEEFRSALLKASDGIDGAKAQRVLSNWTGTFHSGDTTELIDALTRQVSGTVRWRENMETIKQTIECGSVLEIGPDRPLRGFFKAAGVNITSVVDVRTAQRAFRTGTELAS